MRPPSPLHLAALVLALAGLVLTVRYAAVGDFVQDPARAWRPVDPAEAGPDLPPTLPTSR